jgi:hypothetical protein
LVGHLVSKLAARQIEIASVTLIAPACTAAFALKHFGRAVKRGRLAPDRFHLHLLSDELERRDSVFGIYHKSFLYLLSRGLEVVHRAPIIGLEVVCTEASDERSWDEASLKSMRDWRKFLKDVRKENIRTVADDDDSRPRHFEMLGYPACLEATLRTLGGRPSATPKPRGSRSLRQEASSRGAKGE